MRSTVLVVHGVNNRSESGFTKQATKLGQNVGLPGLDWVPVYWGDLAPAPKDLVSVPTHEDDSANLETPGDDSDYGREVPREPTGKVKDRTVELIKERTGESPDQYVTNAVHDAIDRASVRQRIIRPEVATVLADLVAVWPPEGSAAVQEGLRDHFRQALQRIAKSVDREVGRAIGQTLEEVLRGTQAGIDKLLATTIGDVLAYESNGDRIRGRIDRAYHRAEGRTHIVAHSLGSLACAEWLLGAHAVRNDETPLETPPGERRIGTFLTFGSQVSLFAELHGLLRPDGTRPAALKTPQAFEGVVDQWVNIWHQFDPLAFVMNRALTPAHAVRDERLQLDHTPGDALEIATAHTSYWRDENFIEMVRSALGNAD